MSLLDKHMFDQELWLITSSDSLNILLDVELSIYA